MCWDGDQKMRYQQATPRPNTHRFVRPVVNECRPQSAICPPVASEMFHQEREGAESERGYVPVQCYVSNDRSSVRDNFGMVKAQSDKAET